MPVYDLTAVAHALDFEPKQLDNLLSRNALTGVAKKRRGIARRLSPDVVVVIRLAKQMADAFDLSPGSLFPVAQRIADGGNDTIDLGPSIVLRVDLGALRADTLDRLNAAVEVVGRRRRGRPPTRPEARFRDAH